MPSALEVRVKSRSLPSVRPTPILLTPGFWLLTPILELLPAAIIPAMQGAWLYPKIEETY
jgi:hypothetical protein